MDGYWDPLEETEIVVEQLWDQLDETATAYTGLSAVTMIGAGFLMYTIWLLVSPVFEPLWCDLTIPTTLSTKEHSEPAAKKVDEEELTPKPRITPPPVRTLPQYGPITGAGELTESQVGDINLTQEELKRYNGSEENLPLYVAVKGVIYDVTKSRHLYGPGKPYAMFAGKDVSNALAKWSLAPWHLKGDIGSLSKAENRKLDYWKKTFDNKYTKRGSINWPL